MQLFWPNKYTITKLLKFLSKISKNIMLIKIIFHFVYCVFCLFLANMTFGRWRENQTNSEVDKGTNCGNLIVKRQPGELIKRSIGPNSSTGLFTKYY